MFAQSGVRLIALALAAGAASTLSAPAALADRDGNRGGDRGGRNSHSSSGFVYKHDGGRGYNGHDHYSGHSKVGVGLSFNFGGGDCWNGWGVGVGYSSGYYGRPYYGGSSWYGYNDCWPRVRTHTRYSSGVYCPPAVVYAPPASTTYIVREPAPATPTVVVIDQAKRSDAGSQPSAAPVVVKQSYTVDPRELQRGWALLSDGQAERAQRVFSSLAQLSENGQAKAGFALSSALLREDATAAWAMRRAYFFGSSDLMYIPVDRAMRARIDGLVDRYADRLAAAGPDRDALFMIAALEHLRGDSAIALVYADRAIAAGDDSQSALILRSLVGGAQTPPAAPMYGATTPPATENAAPLYSPATASTVPGVQPGTGTDGP